MMTGVKNEIQIGIHRGRPWNLKYNYGDLMKKKKLGLNFSSEILTKTNVHLLLILFRPTITNIKHKLMPCDSWNGPSKFLICFQFVIIEMSYLWLSSVNLLCLSSRRRSREIQVLFRAFGREMFIICYRRCGIFDCYHTAPVSDV